MGIAERDVYKDKMLDIKSRNVFTESKPFSIYIEELCRRYARVYGEILDRKDYKTMLAKLESKGFIY